MAKRLDLAPCRNVGAVLLLLVGLLPEGELFRRFGLAPDSATGLPPLKALPFAPFVLRWIITTASSGGIWYLAYLTWQALWPLLWPCLWPPRLRRFYLISHAYVHVMYFAYVASSY